MTSDEVAQLYERFGYAVHRRCVRILGAGAASEDAAQDVFVRVLRYGDGFHGTSALAWLQRIADRACLDRIGHERRRNGADGGEAERRAAEAAALLPTPEASRLLRELLAKLPRTLREIAILYHLDEMNQDEIARTLHCSTMTVKRRLRALQKHARSVTGADPEEAEDAELAS